jgi:hypothetical protein
MTAMYSITDTNSPAFRLVQSIAHEEMLHAELAANVYNAFQPTAEVHIGPFQYTREGGVPHLDFVLDPHAVAKYGEPDARLGALNLARLGTMCLIELPESLPPSLDPDREEYASLGDFYTALRFGMQQHSDVVRGNHNQVDYFGSYYRNLNPATVTADGPAGLNQALQLIDVITEQGEGRTNTNETVPPAYRNTADGYDPSSCHFEKFNSVRDAVLSGRGPTIYLADPGKRGTEPQRVLAANFEKLTTAIRQLFNGLPVRDPFGALMPTVGANIRTCWREGVVPEFSTARSMG